MLESILLPLLAELPQRGYYFHPAKIIVFLLLLVIWWHAWAWIDKDSVKVRSNRPQWTALIGASAMIGVLGWLFIPVWLAGFLVYLFTFGPALAVYVVFRNRRVSPSQTVLTPAHLKRLMERKAPSEEAVHAKDRVRIKGADGKYPAWPTDPVQHEGFQALQDLLFDALWRRASEMDVLLAGQQAAIRYKIDGVVREREPVPRPQADVMISHLKRIGGMDPEEIRRPQEGHLTGTIGAGGSGDKKVEVRIKSFGSTQGHRIHCSLLAEESRFRINELGLTKSQFDRLEPLIEQLQGLIVVCGIKESGVTGTLYACVRGHDAFMRNIHTVELAKAMDIDNVTQHLFDGRGGQVSFSRQVQSVFRTDPDIVMVGDCADRETAVLCAEYAEQKKVYLGIGAKDSFDGLRKLMEMVGDNRLVAKSLNAVLGQRLIRKLCVNCRKGYRPDAELLKKANLPMDQNRPFYRPPNRNEVEVDKQGNPIVCPVCQGSGYHGRTGIFEVLIISDPIRELIAKGASLMAIKAQARKEKMAILQETGLQKVYEGISSINEVLRVSKDE